MGAAAITPSSTTMSMLAVDAVSAGHVTTRQMLVIMLGADIGLTLTVQLIALSIHAYAPIIVLAGVLLMQFARRKQWRGTGQVILSLGLLFQGVHVIHEAAAAYAPGADLLTLLEIAQRHPIALSSLAAVLAIALQSSTATVGLVLSLAAASHTTAGGVPVTLGLALPVVFGANVGVSITTLIVGYGRVESRRLGAGESPGQARHRRPADRAAAAGHRLARHHAPADLCGRWRTRTPASASSRR